MSADNSRVLVYWDNSEKTILIYDFAESWTWTDFYNAKAKADAMIDGVPHEVAVIFSGPHNVRLPENFISNVVNVSRAKHPRARLIIVIINNAFVRAMFSTAVNLYRRELQIVTFVTSLEEARRIANNSLETS